MSNGTKSMVNQGVGIVVALVVASIMVAFVLTVGIDELVAADTTNWSDGAQSLYDILDLLFILTVFLVVIGWAIDAF